MNAHRELGISSTQNPILPIGLPHTPFPFLPLYGLAAAPHAFSFCDGTELLGSWHPPSPTAYGGGHGQNPFPALPGGLEGSSLPGALCCVGRGGAALRPTQPVQQLVTGRGEQRALPPSLI